jgi:hypothetical protein
MKRKTLIAALAAGSLMGLAAAVQAAPAVVAGTGYGGTPVYGYPGQTVLVQPAPPAPMHEAVPAPREGYIWAPGHYVWDNGRYMWRSGQWVATRPGYAWQAAHWEQRADGSWYLVGGTWVRTDSYASYQDEATSEAGYYRNRDPWGDRDGDGVINRDDRFPFNPRRF